MPNWKKLVVSGSNAVLNQVTASSFLSTTVSGVGFVGTASWAQSSSQAVSSSYVNLLAGPNITINYQSNGIAITGSGGSGSPGGPIHAIQFNKSSQFSGSGKFTYNEPTNTVALSGSFINCTIPGVKILDTSQYATYDGNESASVDWGNRFLIGSNGFTKAVQWGTSRLASGSGHTLSLNWSDRTLNDRNGIKSADWDARTLNDSLTTSSLDWQARRLYNTTGLIPTVDWDKALLSEITNGGNPSLEWNIGQLYLPSVNNQVSVDWANWSLYDSNAAVVVSVDWNTRILYDDSGTPTISVDWNGRNLTDLNGNTALTYTNTTTNDGVRLYGTASYAISASHLIGGGGSGATFNGGTNVNNRLITATSTTPELNGEANLTFDGSTLLVTGSLTVSGSSTLTNIGPAVFSGSVVVTQGGFTGSLSGTATSASFVTSIKSGVVTSFGGNPKTGSVTFSPAYANTSYAVTVTGVDARSWTIQSKASTGFTINSNSNTALTGDVYWIAVPYNG